MEKGQLWTIVGVALIVAVVASLVTASITGNVIRLNQDRFGKYKVYTVNEVYNKEEIDQIFEMIGPKIYDSIDTKIESLIGENRISISGQYWISSDNQIEINGKKVCGESKICLFGFGGLVHPNTSYLDADRSGIIPCDFNMSFASLSEHNDWLNGTKATVQYVCTGPYYKT